MTIWYCHLVGQEQSAAGRKKYGAHPDAGKRRPVKAEKTEFAGATLEFKPDGTYTLAAPEFAPTNSHGTWSSKDDVLVVTQAKDCINGHEAVQYVRSSGDAVVFAFRLVADAHDGLDTLVLTFRREAPAEAVPAGGFLEQLLAAKDETEVFEVLKTITPDEWPGRARQM